MSNTDEKITAANLADLIDSLMQQGSEHGNVDFGEESGGIRINTHKSNDCSGKAGACCQPTELLDDEDF